MPSTRILIADDHSVVRTAIAHMLDSQPDLQVVGEARDGQEAVEQALELTPDVLLMDISMPRLNGIEAARRIHAILPDVRIIGLSMHDEREVIDRMRQAGAVAFVIKSAAADELISAIRAAG